ncbi:hypothetical protein ABS642_07525 [Microbacterium sp. A8/3-1]|uniref:Uncharacterized protein n=1 Tax=Microbacterium sp. A8/3-1 TaxID=3160749 RepID=A0AAU7W2E9_9MICO
MSDFGTPVHTWLGAQKRRSDLLQVTMSLGFDLDGALEAGQWELAWYTRQTLLEFSLRLFLQERGAELDELTECAGAFETLNPALADEVWGLLLEDMPSNQSAVQDRIDAALRFIGGRLRLPDDRPTMIAAWADSVKLLRDVASSIGLANQDDWYLSANDSDDWYQEIRKLLDTQYGFAASSGSYARTLGIQNNDKG